LPAVRERQVQSEFQDGMVRQGDRSEIPKTGAYDIQNGLLDDGGDPYRRGGTKYKSNAALAGTKVDWGWDGYFKAGRRTIWANDASNYFAEFTANDETPIVLRETAIEKIEQSAQLKDILFISGGFMYAGGRVPGVYSTGKVKVTKGSAQVVGTGTEFKVNVEPGSFFKVGATRTYVVENVPSNTELVLSDAWEGETEAEKAYETRSLASHSEYSAYKAFQYMCVCANRLVGIVDNKIYFTEVNNPHTFTNSLGTTNVQELPPGTKPFGLATLGQTVMIFTSVGLWSLEGLALSIVDQNGNSQHRLQPLSSEIMLVGALGLATWEGRLVTPTTGGIILVDEVSGPEQISQQIEGHYQGRLLEGWKVGQAEVFRDHYFLPLVDPAGSAKEVLVCRLDQGGRRGPPWTRFTGHGGEIKAFFSRPTESPGTGLLLGGHGAVSRIVNCSSYFTPSLTYRRDANESSHSFVVVPRDLDTGQLTINAVRQLRVRGDGRGEDETGCKLRALWSRGETADLGPADAEDEEGSVYYYADGQGEFSDGNNPVKFRVNKRLRRGRFMVKTEGPYSSFALRSIEVDTRPSGTGRR